MNLKPSLLRALVSYDPATGLMTWKARGPFMFDGIDPDAKCGGWNSRHVGRPALACVDGSGYRHGSIMGRSLKAHRVAWVIVHGFEPSVIDHINGNPLDNRISNLRDVDHAENRKNMALQCRNRSGVHGVGRIASGLWRARIKVGGIERHLGNFQDFGAAVAARKAAEVELGFHPNHGRR